MNPKIPNLIIIGSAKCGTTALASILACHPDCCMSRPKEVSFFQDTIDFQPNPNYEKGWEWYQKAFSHYTGESVIGEATPSYSDRTRSPNTAKRIYEFNPNMKIIYMVRDPLQRQISTWKMQYAFGLEKSSPWRREDQWAIKGFEYWMKRQYEVKQWDVCRYSYQLEAYEVLFEKRNIHVSFLEDWKVSKEEQIRNIMEFLGLDSEFYNFQAPEQANKACDRTIERPLIKTLRTAKGIRAVVQLLPLSWRNWARPKISKVKLTVPNPELSVSVVSDFIQYIEQDAQAFLIRHGKPLEYWMSHCPRLTIKE